MKRQYLVLVTWHDAYERSVNGWRGASDANADITAPAVMRTAGYIVKRTRHYVVVAQTMAHDGDYTGTMSIPAGCVVSIRRAR